MTKYCRDFPEMKNDKRETINKKQLKMKTLVRLLFLILCLPPLLSCHHNRLKTDEKELAKAIRSQEERNQEPGLKTSSTEKGIRGSLRKKEIRSVDKERPPVKIDILKLRARN
jgi:hypothetical protein